MKEGKATIEAERLFAHQMCNWYALFKYADLQHRIHLIFLLSTSLKIQLTKLLKGNRDGQRSPSNTHQNLEPWTVY